MSIFKPLLTALTLSGLFPFVSSQPEYIAPTGTYVLDSHTKTVDGETYGYFGTIQVKAIKHDKIVMTFYICKGAPSYNSGSFVDTLDYLNNQAVYKDQESNDCLTEFKFQKKSISVIEKEHSRTCWGQGVVAHGVFKKQSSAVPVLKYPLTDEVLE